MIRQPAQSDTREEASAVALASTAGEVAVPAAVRACMEAADWRRFISPGAEVCLKPNLGWDRFLPGAVTSPWVVEGVVQTIRDYVGKIYVVEADQALVNCERALRQTRIDRVIEKYGLEWVNLSTQKFVEVEVPGAGIGDQVSPPAPLAGVPLTPPLLLTPITYSPPSALPADL